MATSLYKVASSLDLPSHRARQFVLRSTDRVFEYAPDIAVVFDERDSLFIRLGSEFDITEDFLTEVLTQFWDTSRNRIYIGLQDNDIFSRHSITPRYTVRGDIYHTPSRPIIHTPGRRNRRKKHNPKAKPFIIESEI